MFQPFGYLIGDGKVEDSELNGSKTSQNLICPRFFLNEFFYLSLSFPNIQTIHIS